MQHWSDKLALLILTAWVGSLWAIGFVAAPVLFTSLSDQTQLAGTLAGKMFEMLSYISLAASLLLLIQRLARLGTPALSQAYFWLVLLMLVLAGIGHFGVAPIISNLKQQALPADVLQSVFADRFRTWHGIASINHVLQSLLGAVLIIKIRN